MTYNDRSGLRAHNSLSALGSGYKASQGILISEAIAIAPICSEHILLLTELACMNELE